VASTLEIQFRGLICHLFDGRPHCAVMVEAMQHESVLLLPSSATVQGLEPKSGWNEDGLVAYDIEGRVLELKDEMVTGSTTSKDLTHVPSLTDLSDCKTLHPSARRALTGFGFFSAFFDHPDGAYSVYDHFFLKADYGSYTNECVARTVRLFYDKATDPVEITARGGVKITIPAGSTIRFRNLPMDPADIDSPNRHFGHYRKIFENGNRCALRAPRHNDQDCTASAVHRPAAPGLLRTGLFMLVKLFVLITSVFKKDIVLPLTSVECSNSQFP
jgi:hypothetical protein